MWVKSSAKKSRKQPASSPAPRGGTTRASRLQALRLRVKRESPAENTAGVWRHRTARCPSTLSYARQGARLMFSPTQRHLLFERNVACRGGFNWSMKNKDPLLGKLWKRREDLPILPASTISTKRGSGLTRGTANVASKHLPCCCSAKDGGMKTQLRGSTEERGFGAP